MQYWIFLAPQKYTTLIPYSALRRQKNKKSIQLWIRLKTYPTFPFWREQKYEKSYTFFWNMWTLSTSKHIKKYANLYIFLIFSCLCFVKRILSWLKSITQGILLAFQNGKNSFRRNLQNECMFFLLFCYNLFLRWPIRKAKVVK